MTHASSERSIRRIPTSEPRLFAFEIAGKISDDDIEEMAAILTGAFEAHGEVDIILVMRDYQGAELGAIFNREALAAQAKAASSVRRYAVVGAPGWAETMINLFDPVSPVDARTFDLADEEEAWTWVRTGT